MSVQLLVAMSEIWTSVQTRQILDSNGFSPVVKLEVHVFTAFSVY